AGGSERAPGGDPGQGLWPAGQGPPPPDWPGSVYSNVNYFVARVLTEHVTGRAFEDAVEELVLRPLGLAWSPDAEPEPRTLGYSRWMPGAPGRRSPATFRGHAGPAGWHVSACGLADGAWSLFGGPGLDADVRRAMLTRDLGIMSAEERGLPVRIHSGVWTPGGRQGFELGLGLFPGDVGGGFATNTWANVRGSRVLRTVWREHTPVVAVVDAGPGTVRVSADYDRIEGAELRWTTDPSASLATAIGSPRLEEGVLLPAGGSLRVAAFLRGRWASLPIEVPLASAGKG
ncbi:MAG TPA: serine hydrolase domain-containing protein, partial [Longimicrobiales bacterium]|nr:serine hydrolase domain-containing protein [Longimicrobiales bacterium]